MHGYLVILKKCNDHSHTETHYRIIKNNIHVQKSKHHQEPTFHYKICRSKHPDIKSKKFSTAFIN